ncbi:enoyl-CoA hydratase/isomerase family protein [Aeromicrobium fastidiosum]|uniref:enoyl-CoA hydratase/isomerase family protein n=1 Tax=Aeromicrobium TaxID=2040 RepID=UPI001780486F|nr:enoyl-CoA hydratase/isomerase family protein [Aeromicrobium fastidiosum]MBD8605500.1 enoyl-CoA hydratase/isomerase family protein [Aeromicrobium sp. CFBP 8757]MCL8250417.1 enoyl-CoA hydratase/isomerase family protein [Aeromicrobium fastidiosum]
MSSPETVVLRRESETTAVLTLARPERRNAINGRLAAELAEAVATIEGWGVLVATLDAEGPAFCAGVDLAELDTGGAALDSVVDSLLAAPIHWTAVVQGAARGGALAMLGACPRVLCGASATFGLPELSKGFFPSELIGAQAAAVGRRAAFDLAFSAAPVDAEEARRIGLVSQIVPDHELRDHAVATTTALATADPEAIRVGVAAWQSTVRAAV